MPRAHARRDPRYGTLPSRGSRATTCSSFRARRLRGLTPLRITATSSSSPARTASGRRLAAMASSASRHITMPWRSDITSGMSFVMAFSPRPYSAAIAGTAFRPVSMKARSLPAGVRARFTPTASASSVRFDIRFTTSTSSSSFDEKCRYTVAVSMQAARAMSSIDVSLKPCLAKSSPPARRIACLSSRPFVTPHLTADRPRRARHASDGRGLELAHEHHHGPPLDPIAGGRDHGSTLRVHDVLRRLQRRVDPSPPLAHRALRVPRELE